MKVPLIALAALTTSAAALAQPSVTVFGVVDMAVEHGATNGPGGTSEQLTSGANRTSRLGLRGTEDLGGGMTASIWLEGQLYTNSGAAGKEGVAGNQRVTTPRYSGVNFDRRSTVSLAAYWGELRLGRD